MDLYDEFGNYTGPSLDDEEDFDEDEDNSNYAPDDYEENNGALVEGNINVTILQYNDFKLYFTNVNSFYNIYSIMQLKVTWILMIKTYQRIGKCVQLLLFRYFRDCIEILLLSELCCMKTKNTIRRQTKFILVSKQ